MMKSTAYATVAVLAAAAGFAIYRLAIEPSLLPEGESAQVIAGSGAASGQSAMPQPGTPEAPQGLPDVLPDFTLADLDGQQRSIRSWPGKSMIVNFWATWCAPCRREIPLLRSLQQERGDEGFQVVGVAVDFRDDVVKYAQEIGIDYPILIGEQEGLDAVNRFGQGSLGFPFTVFTDNQHRIVLFHLGEIHEAEAQIMLDAVERVNRGELTPQAARIVAAKQLAQHEEPA